MAKSTLKDSVIEAALGLAAQQSWDLISFEEIIEKAGVSWTMRMNILMINRIFWRLMVVKLTVLWWKISGRLIRRHPIGSYFLMFSWNALTL